MPAYQAESFYRAKITTPILSGTAVPFTIVVSKLPTLATWLLTISPNTEYEEIVEYNNVVEADMTIDIIKRGIKPTSILLTTDTVDYNNVTYMRAHSQNDIIRGDVNHIHINQSIGNTTLATEAGVGISKLSVAAVDPGDPIVVGTNDPRVGDASTTVKATVKLSVAPVSAANPIALGANDPIATATDSAAVFSDITTNNVSTARHWLAPKSPNNVDVYLDWLGSYSRAQPAGSITMFGWSTAPTWWLLADGSAVNRTTYATLFGILSTTYGVGDGSTTFNLPNFKGRTAVGRDSGQAEFDVLGETGGAKTHTLTSWEMPSHTHNQRTASGGGGWADYWNIYAGSAPVVSHTFTDQGWLESTGWGGAHNNLQPYLTVNYIIKY